MTAGAVSAIYISGGTFLPRQVGHFYSAVYTSVVRVGFEDSFYYQPGKAAKSNDVLVKKIRKLIDFLGFEVATIEEARQLLLE